jgi:hypothetical protein
VKIRERWIFIFFLLYFLLTLLLSGEERIESRIEKELSTGEGKRIAGTLWEEVP